MTWLNYFVLLLCVLGLSSGHILFKRCGARMKDAGLAGLISFRLRFFAMSFATCLCSQDSSLLDTDDIGVCP